MIINQRLQAKHLAKQAELEASVNSKGEAEVQKAAQVAAIMARKTMEGWSADGKHLFGTPITGDEWMSLKDTARCILTVDGVPVEAFIVSKVGSTVKKVRVTPISATKPTVKTEEKAQNALPVVIGQVTGTIKGETREFFIFPTTADVKRLQANGLNSGTWVGVRPQDDADITVYSVTKEEYKPIGVLRKKAKTAEAATA